MSAMQRDCHGPPTGAQQASDLGVAQPLEMTEGEHFRGGGMQLGERLAKPASQFSRKRRLARVGSSARGELGDVFEGNLAPSLAELIQGQVYSRSSQVQGRRSFDVDGKVAAQELHEQRLKHIFGGHPITGDPISCAQDRLMVVAKEPFDVCRNRLPFLDFHGRL